jgi:hypothetical protein
MPAPINFIASKESMGVRIAEAISNQIFRILNEQLTDYDLSQLQTLFSNPYSFKNLSFDKDQEFIESPLGEKASAFVAKIPYRDVE